MWQEAKIEKLWWDIWLHQIINYFHNAVNYPLLCASGILLSSTATNHTAVQEHKNLSTNCLTKWLQSAERFVKTSTRSADPKFHRLGLRNVKFCYRVAKNQRLDCLLTRWIYAVSWGTALQARRSRVDNPFCRTLVLGSTQPLTEISTRNISWGIKAADAWGWQSYHLHVPIV
jgi:hypothetical protein